MKVTEDKILGGRVHLVQPETGFRAGTDSLLLAASLEAGFEGEALELGVGAGGALLPAAFRLSSARFVGLERDAQMAALCRQGVTANAMEARVEVAEGDAGALPPAWENRFGLVFANPPYFPPGTISSPGPGKGDAYLERLDLEGWLKAMLFALKPRARLVIIHRAGELARLLAGLERRAGDITILPVRPAPGEPARRVLVLARKGLRPGPARLLDGLDLYEWPGGRMSARHAALLDAGGLEWR